MQVDFPEKLGFLFEPSRYKVAYGGRGSAKSWSFARALLVKGKAKKHRILCAREVQKSIKDSVHKLLSDQIQAMGMGDFYEVIENAIRGKNGTEFAFAACISASESPIIKAFSEGHAVLYNTSLMASDFFLGDP